MKKQNWSERPVTWGGYLKLCGICYAISMLFGLVWYAAFFEPAWYTSAKARVRKLIDRFKK